MKKKLEAEQIGKVINAIVQSDIDEEKALYVSTKGETVFDISDIEHFHYLIKHPFNRFLYGMIRTEVADDDDVVFLYENYRFIESHFNKIIKQKEGMSCCADKSRAIVRALVRFFTTGETIVWNYDQKYTFHLPREVFKTHVEVMDFYKALRSLYYGNSVPFLEALKGLA